MPLTPLAKPDARQIQDVKLQPLDAAKAHDSIDSSPSTPGAKRRRLIRRNADIILTCDHYLNGRPFPCPGGVVIPCPNPPCKPCPPSGCTTDMCCSDFPRLGDPILQMKQNYGKSCGAIALLYMEADLGLRPELRAALSQGGTSGLRNLWSKLEREVYTSTS